jgi:hypothetical protein
MGYLNNSVVTVDAILTDTGRQFWPKMMVNLELLNLL